MDLKELLKLAIQEKASDLHLTENSPPVLRIDGKLVLTNKEVLNKEELKKSIYGILSDSQKEKFEHDRELDFSLELEGLERFRVNVHIQKGSVEDFLENCDVVISFPPSSTALIYSIIAKKPIILCNFFNYSSGNLVDENVAT